MPSLALPQSPPASPSWLKAFRDLPHTYGFQPVKVEGRLPPELEGTLVRVGPVTFGVGEQRYGHWFDGDGGVLAVRLGGGEARAAARLIETPSIRAERTAGKVLFSNYGTPAPTLWRRLFGGVKNAANTSAMTWNGRLFALVEASRPTELLMDDLRTLGETDLDGLVGPAFSAHPHPVVPRKASYNFGVRYGAVTWLDLYELPDDKPAVRHLGGLPLPGTVLVHDFIATANHLVFLVAPMRMNLFRTMMGRGSLSENFEWKPELGTEVIVVPIDRPSKAVRFQAEPFHAWHFGNGFEQGGRIYIDFVRYPDFRTNQWLAEQMKGWANTEIDGTLHRATLDVKAGTLHCEQVSERRCEFPGVSPLRAGIRHRYVYLAGHVGRETWRGPQDAVIKVDMDTGAETVVRLGDEHHPSEPLFIPRPGGKAEDDGWLLIQGYDAAQDQSYIAVLDAKTPQSGPVARVVLEHVFPFTFHGTWVPKR
ncbi:carotenoid oxygenase family protein [Archangium primigenium]|uniref:carotenoid oxygenase family protein n=1 Tax=[Archangium] primigenium TaxID=2792470 RepID=UPI00195A36BB|nr:carotenoid oxygenase family protein [Archangium primigenium]MBM7117306.1 carotenoid oxygenase family protein [Archangium primigenium]